MKVLFFKLFFSLFFLDAFFFSQFTFAFRGPQESQELSQPKTPITSFPGFFDTEVTQKNKLVVEIPTSSVDYGLTDRFTVGLNAATLGVIAIRSSPAYLLKLRYRVYSSSLFSSAISAYAGGFWMKSGDTKINYQVYILTQTNSISLSSQDFLLFQFIGFSYSQNRSDAIVGSSLTNDETRGLESFAGGLGYHHFFTETFGFETQLLYPFTYQVNLNNLDSAATVELRNRPVIYRVLFDIFDVSIGKGTLFSFGGMGMYDFKSRLNFILPTVTWSLMF